MEGRPQTHTLTNTHTRAHTQQALKSTCGSQLSLLPVEYKCPEHLCWPEIPDTQPSLYYSGLSPPFFSWYIYSQQLPLFILHDFPGICDRYPFHSVINKAILFFPTAASLSSHSAMFWLMRIDRAFACFPYLLTRCVCLASCSICSLPP